MRKGKPAVPRRKTTAELCGPLVETIDAPEADTIYALRKDEENAGVHIIVMMVICSSYMPNLLGARSWVRADRKKHRPTAKKTAARRTNSQ